MLQIDLDLQQVHLAKHKKKKMSLYISARLLLVFFYLLQALGRLLLVFFYLLQALGDYQLKDKESTESNNCGARKAGQNF